MTEAQTLCENYRVAVAAHANTWKWATRATASLVPLGKTTIGYPSGRAATCAMFRCVDGSRFLYDLNGAQGVWACPKE